MGGPDRDAIGYANGYAIGYAFGRRIGRRGEPRRRRSRPRVALAAEAKEDPESVADRLPGDQPLLGQLRQALPRLARGVAAGQGNLLDRGLHPGLGAAAEDPEGPEHDLGAIGQVLVADGPRPHGDRPIELGLVTEHDARRLGATRRSPAAGGG